MTVDAASRPTPDADDQSEHADFAMGGHNPSVRPGDPRPIIESGAPSDVDGRFPTSLDPDGATGSREIGSASAPGHGGLQDPGRDRSADAVLATGSGAQAAPIDAASATGVVAATGVLAATGVARTAGDRGTAAGVETAGSNRISTPSTIPVPEGPGAKAIPEGMRGPDPALVNDRETRSQATVTQAKSSRPRGASAVVRAAEMNTELRNARIDGDASHGSRSGQAQGSTVFATAGSTAAAIAVPGSASPGLEAQSLPTGPASVAPMESEAGSGRTVGGVARGLQALSSQRGGTLVMRLDPGNLGQVRMEMTLEAGRVQVVIAAAGDAARGLLRENLGVLRHALEDRGFAVERLAVESTARTTADSSGPRGDSRGDGQDARGGQGSSDRQDASDERSRGRRDDATHRRAERNRSEPDRFEEVLAGSGGISSG